MAIDDPYAPPSMRGNGSANTVAETTPPTIPTSQEHTTEVKNSISNGDLPWAIVNLPTTSAGQGGIGFGGQRHNLQPETWVIGFFLDGENCQQPMITGVLPGGPGAGSGFGSSGSVNSGYDGEATPVNESAVGGSNNQEIAFNFLVQNGYTPAQAAGIIGNLSVESFGRLDPTLDGNVEKGTARDDGQLSMGIAQWRGPRRAALIQFAKVRNQNPKELTTQLAYLVHELKRVPEHSGTAERLLQSAKNPRDAAIAFVNFERPGGGQWSGAKARWNGGNGTNEQNPTVLKRIQNAYAIYNKMMSKGVGSTQAGQGPRGDN